jgi:hypothetical protein
MPLFSACKLTCRPGMLGQPQVPQRKNPVLLNIILLFEIKFVLTPKATHATIGNCGGGIFTVALTPEDCRGEIS